MSLSSRVGFATLGMTHVLVGESRRPIVALFPAINRLLDLCRLSSWPVVGTPGKKYPSGWQPCRLESRAMAGGRLGLRSRGAPLRSSSSAGRGALRWCGRSGRGSSRGRGRETRRRPTPSREAPTGYDPASSGRSRTGGSPGRPRDLDRDTPGRTISWPALRCSTPVSHARFSPPCAPPMRPAAVHSLGWSEAVEAGLATLLPVGRLQVPHRVLARRLVGHRIPVQAALKAAVATVMTNRMAARPITPTAMPLPGRTPGPRPAPPPRYRAPRRRFRSGRGPRYPRCRRPTGPDRAGPTA